MHCSDFLEDRHPYIPENSEDNFFPGVHPHQVTRAFGDRAGEKLAALLTVEGLLPEGRVEALSILLSLSRDQENKCRTVALGMVNPLASLLEDDNATVRERAAQVLASLAVVKAGRDAIAADSSTTLLTALLADGHGPVREAASLALMQMATFADGIDALVASEGTVSRMVAHLNDPTGLGEGGGEEEEGGGGGDEESKDAAAAGGSQPSDLVMFHLVSALANVSKNERGVIDAIAADVVAKLVELLKRCPATDKAVVPGRLQATLMALWLVADFPDGKEQAIAAGSVPMVAERLSDPSAEVRRCGAGALMSMAIAESGKRACLEPDVVPRLAALMQDPDPSVRTNARQGEAGDEEEHKGAGGGWGSIVFVGVPGCFAHLAVWLLGRLPYFTRTIFVVLCCPCLC